MCERDADVQTDYQAQDKSQPVRVVKGVQFLEADQLDAEVPPFIYSRVAQGAIPARVCSKIPTPRCRARCGAISTRR
jgi:hypothetical protein